MFGNDGPAYARDVADLITAATPGEAKTEVYTNRVVVTRIARLFRPDLSGSPASSSPRCN